MAAIPSIDVTIGTGDADGAGTDGNVYLGICGREFHLDSTANNFVKGSIDKFRLGKGAGSKMSDPDLNDPRNPPVNSDNLGTFPVYIRFEPSGDNPDGNLKFVNVELGGTGFGVNFLKGLWLGTRAGKICFLKQGKFGE
jgi:hypothetical protein